MRTKLRYLVAPIWILNIIFLFGSLSAILSDKSGQLSTIDMLIVVPFFVFFIYLFYDITKFKRKKMIKIIGFILILSSIYYVIVLNIIMVIPTIITGILVLKYKLK
jgi:hypothetical protein